MAPDKIFLHKVRDEENSRFHEIWFESRARLVPSEEYIRKDALLDLLKEYKDNPVITDLQKGNIQEIIEKIETL